MSNGHHVGAHQDDELERAGLHDLHELVAAYVLDAVDDAERAAFEAHLARCPECRGEVDELRETSLALSAGMEEHPSPALREQLLAQIAVIPQDSAQPGEASPTGQSVSPSSCSTTDELAHRRAGRHRSPGRFSRWALAGAAAAAVAIATMTVTQWPDDASEPSAVAVQEVLDAPDAVRTSAPVDGATVTVVTAYSVHRAVVLTEDLAGAPAGQDYQLWFVGEDGTAVSAGLLPRNDQRFLLEGEPGEAVAVGITLEPTGGSEQPTSEPLVAVPLKG